MNSIELKVTVLAGLVGGVILVLAEMIAMHRKVRRYRDHVHGLVQAKRYLRLFAEGVGVFVVAMIQPVLITFLLFKAMDNFTTEFSAHAVQELQQGVQHGTLDDSRTLRGHHPM